MKNVIDTVIPQEEFGEDEAMKSGYRRRVEHRQRIMQAPLVRPCLLAAAGDVENVVENFPAGFFDGGFTGGNTAGVDVHQIKPAVGQIVAGSDFNHGYGSQTVRRASTGGEHLRGNTRGQLLRTAHKIAGGRGGENQAFFGWALTQLQHFDNRRLAGLGN